MVNNMRFACDKIWVFEVRALRSDLGSSDLGSGLDFGILAKPQTQVSSDSGIRGQHILISGPRFTRFLHRRINYKTATLERNPGLK